MNRYFLLAALSAAIMLGATGARAESGKTAPAKKEETPRYGFAWKREFKGVALGNLETPWNGSTVFFTVAVPADKKTGKKGQDVVLGVVGKDSRGQNEFEVGSAVRSLYVNGAGDRAVVETKDGKFLSWAGLDKNREPKPVPLNYPSGAVPSQTFNTAVAVDKEKKEAAIYDQNGKKLRSYPLKSIPANVPALWSPYFKDEEYVLVLSAEGEATYYNRDQRLWSLSLGASVKAVASSYMKGDVLAFGTGNEIVFVNAADGKVTGKAAFKADKTSLSCSQGGGFCAAYGSNPDGQRVAVFSPDGRQVWSSSSPVKARHDFKIQALEKGNLVVAGLEEKESPALVAFDEKGTRLWIAPIRDNFKDYKVAWGGKAFSVLYESDLTYYDVTNPPPKEGEEIKVQKKIKPPADASKGAEKPAPKKDK